VLVDRRRSAAGHSWQALDGKFDTTLLAVAVLDRDRCTVQDAARRPIARPPTKTRVGHFGASDGQCSGMWRLGGKRCRSGPCPKTRVSGPRDEDNCCFGSGPRLALRKAAAPRSIQAPTISCRESLCCSHPITHFRDACLVHCHSFILLFAFLTIVTHCNKNVAMLSSTLGALPWLLLAVSRLSKFRCGC
jgi:hypothetical protein